ncbi:MAG: class I SAM-dependent methyltransferase [Desulfatibacillaceae bacterium]
MSEIRTLFQRDAKVCPWWLAYTFDNPLRRLVHNPEKILAPHVEPGMVVADIGCGLGFYTVPLARMVGERGAVVAVDLQQQMLDAVKRRAGRAGVVGRVLPHRAEPGRLGIPRKVDFVLANWMVHEVDDQSAFLAEVRDAMRPGGRFLVAEPGGHVSDDDFARTLETARDAGFTISDGPRMLLSKTAVLAV